MSKAAMRLWAAVLAAGLAASSCLSVQLSSMGDGELARSGAERWNAGDLEGARPFWEAIKDVGVRDDYLGSYDRLAAVEEARAAAVALTPSQAARKEAAFRAVVNKAAALPKGLELPAAQKDGLRPVTVEALGYLTKAGKPDQASSLMKDAAAFLGDSDDYAPFRDDIAAYRRLLAEDGKAADHLEAAKAVGDFDERIGALEAAEKTQQAFESSVIAEHRRLGSRKESLLVALGAKAKKRRGEVRLEIERQVRERAYTFKERIGEEFARVPEGSRLGSMGPEDILKFNEEIRANIARQYDDIVAFAARYPKAIDADAIADVEAQRKALDDKIDLIAAEVRRAKDIASRGKAVMPLLIGLFNPQPGTKAEGEKSRPAVIKGKMAGEAEYWWGMVSIEKGRMNDLVVTLKDGKQVEIYEQNTLSGKQIKKKKLKDLVSRGSRIGNSWPVLNAGAAFPSGQYYVRIMDNGKPDYSGEVVVYSSFVARVR